VRVVWYSFASRSKGKLIFSNFYYYWGDTLERRNCLFFDFSYTITKNNTTGATNSKSEDRREINMETCCSFLWQVAVCVLLHNFVYHDSRVLCYCNVMITNSGRSVAIFNCKMVWFGCMVFNVTFNNISVISWRSVLLVKETGGPGENHRSVASHWQTLSHNVVHPDRDSNSQHQW